MSPFYLIGRGCFGILVIHKPRSQMRTKQLSYAREVGQAATLMYALGHAPFTYFECGNYAEAKAAVDELAVLADDKGTLFFKAQAMIHEGRLLALTGKAADAVHKINTGLTVWRSTGAAIWIPLYSRIGRTRLCYAWPVR